ncbi:MAG: ATP-binding protein [Burkholderiales bacterium PBB3]|nr:MAG: ATP-binding protein [Burkholderiales bacterium PBB3]
MKLGAIATGIDFYDRKTECSDLWGYLENDHVVASGPRRLGKSSIVNRLREEAAAKGLLAQHVDVQGIEGAQAFIDEISSHFPDDSIMGYLSSLGDTAKQWFSAVKKFELKGPGGVGGGIELQANAGQPWHRSATALQARLTAVPVLIFIDEFSVFLQKLLASNQKEAEALLAWLRAWRVTPGVACRFLFTGSIGLNALLEKYGLSAQFNDCYEYPIGPFKVNAACDMVSAFAQRDGWFINTATASYVCERVGWLSPFYLCLLLDETTKAARDRLDETPPLSQGVPTRELTRDDVDSAYERLLSARSRFVHWEQRIHRDLAGADLAFANLVLTALAKNETGLTQRQLHARLAKLEPDPDPRAARLQTILGKLQEEGYTSPVDASGRVKFLSFLLRDYWGRNHV